MKKKALLSSILTVVLCLGLIAGSTLALFTTEEQTDIAVTSGSVRMSAFLREDSVTTYWCDAPVGTDKMFKDGGSARISGKELVLSNMLPGDRVDVVIDVENESNIAIAYRVVMTVEGKLGEVLVATAKSDAMSAEINNLKKSSDWVDVGMVGGAGEAISSITVSVELPTEVGNEYKKATGKVILSIEAVQQNAKDLMPSR